MYSCVQRKGTCTSYVNTSERYCPFIFLLQYSDVVLALKRGDLRLLRHALQEHEDRYQVNFSSFQTHIVSLDTNPKKNSSHYTTIRFLRSGVYLVLEKLELQVYQRLVKKM